MPPKFIPNEQITDVLSLLPVKSLLRFRCLSKSLDSLISNPNFIKLHLTRSSRNADFTLVSTSHLNVIFFTVFRLLHNPPIIINLPEDPNHQLADKGCLFVVGSCNGLLCLFSQFFTSDFNSVTLLRFWNPATRKMSPKLGYCLHKDMWFHPNLTFAYVNSTDTYKVLYLVPGETNVYVFSLGDNIWRTIQDSPVDHDYWINFVNLHDCISWLAIRNYSARYDFNNITLDQFVIVSLYLGTETHSQLSPPIGFREVPIFVPYLSLLKDNLCFSYDYKQTHLVVWQMKEFGVENSWIQLFNISYHNLQIYDHHLNDLDFRLLPLCLSEKSDTILLISTLESEAILYNWRHNRAERIYKPWFNGMDYVESLVSLERLYSWEHN
ncbi:F-box/kelch-repeat protein At3g06240 [Medicago truncatula]|uniref:F-box/kelch-repeat protein At3g06240 n=1 Tax=Medicago truncatula TaxID=3880 RepID=UPI001967B20E|nr:F-box/kelch-repeat protein At3g06240 [Medicago truncatula]